MMPDLHKASERRKDEFLRVKSFGIDEMQQAFSRLVRSHDLTLTGQYCDFVSELSYARLMRSKLSSATVRVSMDVKAFPARDVCLVLGALDRPIDIRIGARRTLIPVGGIELIPPDVPFELYIPPGSSSSMMLEIELNLLEAVIAQELRSDVKQPLRFFDGESGHGEDERSFMDLLGFIHAALALNSPQCRNSGYLARLEELTASALIHTKPNNYTNQLLAIADVAQPRFIRRAEDFIHAHAGESLTLGTIAAASAVSSRTLVRGFHKYKDRSPMSYLLSVRLDRAHRELLAGNLEDVSVTAVATKWGFSNLGRFAALYRQRFGENPATTLRSRS